MTIIQEIVLSIAIATAAVAAGKLFWRVLVALW
jgi:hypothetical protein